MSQVDLPTTLRRVVAVMKAAGYSVASIVALVIEDAPKIIAAPAPASEPPRMISIEHAQSGTTRLVPWTPELERELLAKKNAQAKADAPTPEEHELVFTPSRATSHDLQVAGCQTEYVPSETPAGHWSLSPEWQAQRGKPAPAPETASTDAAEVESAMQQASDEVQALEKQLEARRREFEQFRAMRDDATK